MKEKILEMVRGSAAKEKPYGWLNYQPIHLPGYEETVPLRGRDCFDRSNAIFPHLRKKLGDGPLTLADWGCNIGFFVFEAAKLGLAASGYDSDVRLVDACTYLAASNEFACRPVFHLKKMSVDTVKASPRYDVVFCFSVLHHFKNDKERQRLIEAVANHCNAAYIELDGANYGRDDLEIFFQHVEEVVSTNDRFRDAHRRRKTWYCTNHDGDRTYKNLKDRDFKHERALFLCTQKAGPPIVLKRERVGKNPLLHTWLKTGLGHERGIYQKHPSPFFARLLAHGEDSERRWIELEYIAPTGKVTPQAVDDLYDFLEKSKLFNVDFRVNGFIPFEGRLRMVDLEAVFPVEGSVSDTIARHLRPSGWRPKNIASIDSYAKQRALLKHALCP